MTAEDRPDQDLPVAPGPARCVLVTRPEPGATATAKQLTERGFVPVVAPLLTITQLVAELPPPNALAAVLVTSANALAGLRPDFHGLPLHAVGDATARRARDQGFWRVDSAAGDAAALADLVADAHRPGDGPLLLASGRGQGSPLATALRAFGFRVIHRVVYAASPVAALPDAAVVALRAGRVQAALFFSAETARAFVRLIRRAGLGHTLGEVEAISISRSTGVALRGLRWRHIRVAARPNQDEMLALLR